MQSINASSQYTYIHLYSSNNDSLRGGKLTLAKLNTTTIYYYEEAFNTCTNMVLRRPFPHEYNLLSGHSYAHRLFICRGYRRISRIQDTLLRVFRTLLSLHFTRSFHLLSATNSELLSNMSVMC
jgi:hypothetical protein